MAVQYRQEARTTAKAAVDATQKAPAARQKGPKPPGPCTGMTGNKRRDTHQPSLASGKKALYRTTFAWVQREAAKRGEKETYYVLQTRSIAAVVAAEHAEALQTVGDLDRCYGIGESKLRRYGQDLYQVIKEERLKY